ncbi:MAG: phage tail sheath family protein [Oscillospiraceae bacterium]
MALGGGSWTSQNKVLPGAYINFASAAKASATLSDRGIVAMPLTLNWGEDGRVFLVTDTDFRENCQKIFGYPNTADEMLPLRELFRCTKKLYAYRLVAGAAKATCVFATAKCFGTRGNDLKIIIEAAVDDASKWVVTTKLLGDTLDVQVAATAAGLHDNDYVTFAPTATLAATAGTALTGGTNGTAADGAAYQTFLDKIESYSFNVLGCPVATPTVVSLFTAFTPRMRDEIGTKFQLVVYHGEAANSEGVISVENAVTGFNAATPGFGDFGLVYWVSGAAAGCDVNKSNTNMKYNGELTVAVDYTQTELEAAIGAGKFIFHNVGGTVRVLEDINTLVSTSETKGDIFKANQTVRVIDQIANDTAVIFNTRYLGSIPNDAAGRISLWNDICKLHQALEAIRAIESFDTKSVTVEPGATKKSVVCTVSGLNIINAMSRLYMSVVIA